MELGIFAKTFRRSDGHATLEAVRALGIGCVQFNFECAGLPAGIDVAAIRFMLRRLAPRWKLLKHPFGLTQQGNAFTG